VLNIGNHRGEAVRTLVALLEQTLGRRDVARAAPRPAADVEETFASIDAITPWPASGPARPCRRGIPKFVEWFRDWHGF
jgi:UDP-glucuronate 4-epimerase